MSGPGGGYKVSLFPSYKKLHDWIKNNPLLAKKYTTEHAAKQKKKILKK